MSIYRSWIKNAKDENELQWVKSYEKRPNEELYDLEKDPFEKNNIANQPGYNEVKKDLKEKLKIWMKQQGDKGIETEMTAISRQDRRGKGVWRPYQTKSKY